MYVFIMKCYCKQLLHHIYLYMTSVPTVAVKQLGTHYCYSAPMFSPTVRRIIKTILCIYESIFMKK